MKRVLLGLASVSLGVALAGCPKKDIAIYRTLRGPAQETCDANLRFRADVKDKDKDQAKAKAEAQIRTLVAEKKYCGAYIWNEGSGKTLEGDYNHVADFQLCRCS
jgi:hypothetical protein